MISIHSSERQARVFRALNLLSALAGVVSFTPAQEAFLIDRIGFAPGVVSYVPYCVDTRFFAPDAPGTGSYVMSAGGVPGRDYGTFLEAVRQAGCEAKIVCGGRPYGRGTSRGLERRNERVHVISGIPLTSMRDLYGDAALVVVPLAEGRKDAAGSTVLLEAMAMGKCVVVSGSPGILPYTNAQGGVVLIPPGRPDLLRAVLDRLLASADERAASGRKARALAEIEYDVTCYARRLARVIGGEVLAWPWPYDRYGRVTANLDSDPEASYGV